MPKLKKEIIVNARQNGATRIAILEEGELVELYIEGVENARTIGDVYIGRVRKVMPSIQAAFVDIGQDHDAFLHFSDVSDNLPQMLDMVENPVEIDFDFTAEDDTEKEEAPKPKAKPKNTRRKKDAPKKTSRRTNSKKQADPEVSENDVSATENTTDSTEEETSTKPKTRRGTRGQGRGSSRRPNAKTKTAAEASDDTVVPTSEAEENATTATTEEDQGEQAENTRFKRGRSRSTNKPRNTRKKGKPSETTVDDQVSDIPETQEVSDVDTTATSEPAKKTPTKRKPRATKKQAKAKIIDKKSASSETTSSEVVTDKEAKPSTSSSDKKVSAPAAIISEAPKQTSFIPTLDLTSSGLAAQKKRDISTEGDTADKVATPIVAMPALESNTESEPTKTKTSAKKVTKPRKPRAPRKKKVADSTVETPDNKTTSASSTTPEPAASSETTELETKKTPKARKPRKRNISANDQGKDNPSQDDSSADEFQGKGSAGNNRNGSNNRHGQIRKGNDRNSKKGASENTGAKPSVGGKKGGFQDIHSDHPAHNLKAGQHVLVQITKEPISSKGSRVTTGISMAGRFLVLVPRANYVAVSKRIASSRERRRLRALARSLLPEGFGVIVRTVAQNKDAKSLDTDLRLLLQKWQRVQNKLIEKPRPPQLIYQDVNMVSSIIRDIFSDDYDRIMVDETKVHRNIKGYVQAVAPKMVPAVQHYKGRRHIFMEAGIDREFRAAFEQRVNMPGGGYLFVEHTEAMHVVDVNSGRSGRGLTQEENSLQVNLLAARTITRHLRLRDLGGIIVVDFIDLRDEKNRRRVFDELRKEFFKDRAVTKVLPMSDFGLVQITRQRLRPSITVSSEGLIPQELADAGFNDESELQTLGMVPAEEVKTKIDQWVSFYKDDVEKVKKLTLSVHPFLAAYLNRGFLSWRLRWRLKSVNIRVLTDERIDPLSFRFSEEGSGSYITDKYDYS